MAHAHAPTLQHDKLHLGGIGARLGIPGLLVGVITLAIAFYFGLNSADDRMVNHFFHSYLAAYSFFMAITLGALAFVLIHHLARAGWSVTVRRIAERVSLNMFLMVLLIVPFFIPVHGEDALHRLFHWYHAGAVTADPVLTAKEGYLNPQFFAIRMGIYFTLWCFIAWYFAAKSAQQDQTGDPKISVTLDLAAKPAMVFFGFSLTSFIIDWVMSLNPHWFSTMFGVYYFAGCMLSAFSFLVLVVLSLQKRGRLGNAITHEHIQDLGKWMFAFTFFWGYIAFSQYMLIWYANMPEETQFYIPRQWNGWAGVSLMLLIVHLLIPFPGLMSKHVKRKNAILAFWAVWSLCACALDVFWLVVPNQYISKVPALVGNEHKPFANAMSEVVSRYDIYHVTNPQVAEAVNYPLQAAPLVITALCFVGVGGIYLFATMLSMRSRPLVPLRDPRLKEALGFENI